MEGWGWVPGEGGEVHKVVGSGEIGLIPIDFRALEFLLELADWEKRWIVSISIQELPSYA